MYASGSTRRPQLLFPKEEMVVMAKVYLLMEGNEMVVMGNVYPTTVGNKMVVEKESICLIHFNGLAIGVHHNCHIQQESYNISEHRTKIL